MDGVNNNVNMTAGIFAFNKAKDAKNEQVLSALGMTPETEKAQREIDNTMKEAAQASGQGINIDFKA